MHELSTHGSVAAGGGDSEGENVAQSVSTRILYAGLLLSSYDRTAVVHFESVARFLPFV